MRHFQDELDQLKSRLVGMAGLAEEQVRRAMQALLERSIEKAQEVVDGDDDIDMLEVEVDNAAISLLALQQPMARDLRFITMAMKISSDLERVGDHAVNIAEAVKFMIDAPPFPVLPEVEEMVRLATDMLADALNAFMKGDAAAAREIFARDDRVDELHDNNFRILLTHMMEDPRKITAGMDLLLISGNLERIADLATNICEEVIFLVEGKSVKHHSGERPLE
ncbi:MAG TPA: phosphate signaling complex protein PhoU [Longimicrobiales bacterium]|nr:phosphate signaling complex protein PhoU [Longimicrobiales bacterium]